MRKQQSGFTLIELVMVIVILGILAAFALPKFADLSGDAEKAACNGGRASVKSAQGILHATWLARGKSATVTIESKSYTIVGLGITDAGQIGTLAGLDGFGVVYDDDTDELSPTTATISSGDYSFSYAEATGSTSACATAP